MSTMHQGALPPFHRTLSLPIDMLVVITPDPMKSWAMILRARDLADEPMTARLTRRVYFAGPAGGGRLCGYYSRRSCQLRSGRLSRSLRKPLSEVGSRAPETCARSWIG